MGGQNVWREIGDWMMEVWFNVRKGIKHQNCIIDAMAVSDWLLIKMHLFMSDSTYCSQIYDIW